MPAKWHKRKSVDFFSSTMGQVPRSLPQILEASRPLGQSDACACRSPCCQLLPASTERQAPFIPDSVLSNIAAYQRTLFQTGTLLLFSLWLAAGPALPAAGKPLGPTAASETSIPNNIWAMCKLDHHVDVAHAQGASSCKPSLIP